MSSSLSVRSEILIAGQPIKFATPFTPPFLATAEDASLYQVTIPLNSTATLWDGAPLPATYDFLAVLSDLNIDIEVVVDGGQVDEYHFTIPVLANFPCILPGGTAFAGQTGTQSAFTSGSRKNVTKVNAHNVDTATAANVTVVIARSA